MDAIRQFAELPLSMASRTEAFLKNWTATKGWYPQEPCAKAGAQCYQHRLARTHAANFTTFLAGVGRRLQNFAAASGVTTAR